MLLVFIFLGLFSYGQEVRIKGSIQFKKISTSIRAGEDFSSELISDDNDVRLSVKKLKKRQYWSISVNKSDITWNSSLNIYVRRVNNGSGNGSVWGGTNYVSIQNMPQQFFQGHGLLNNIYVQYKVSGLSVTVPADTYYTDIVYTLYEQ